MALDMHGGSHCSACPRMLISTERSMTIIIVEHVCEVGQKRDYRDIGLHCNNISYIQADKRTKHANE